MLNIHDIKPLSKIPDYSIYIYYALIIGAGLLILFLLYLLYNYIQKKRNNKDKIYYKTLQNISFENPKEDAYTITTYGRLLAKEERSKQLLDELYEDLEFYKYKKEVPSNFTRESKAKFTTFMDSLDVR